MRPGGAYVDATLGGGGHSLEILRNSSPDGIVIGIDRDLSALEAARAALAGYGARAAIRQGNFEDIERIVQDARPGQVDGVLFDLGVSSAQIDQAQRGFSFQAEAPLDMRMGREGPSASDVVNGYDYQRLCDLFKDYGQEREYRRIARSIVRRRTFGRLATTGQLRQAVLETRPAMPQKTLARIFQAIRIDVNQELESLPAGLTGGLAVLKPGGRMVAISYHSLEDTIVKEFYRVQAQPCTCPPKMAVCSCGTVPRLVVLTRRAVRPEQAEVERNPRARSAKLRAAEKI